MAIVAAIFHILNHAVFKASLFMTAGIIDHETGTRDLWLLRGLRHSLPITATLAIVASAAMAGAAAQRLSFQGNVLCRNNPCRR